MRKITQWFFVDIVSEQQCDRIDYTISLIYFTSVITLQNQDLQSNNFVLNKRHIYNKELHNTYVEYNSNGFGHFWYVQIVSNLPKTCKWQWNILQPLRSNFVFGMQGLFSEVPPRTKENILLQTSRKLWSVLQNKDQILQTLPLQEMCDCRNDWRCCRNQGNWLYLC